MQGLKGVIAAAMLVAAAVSLGGCFGHHEKAVVVEPLKLGKHQGLAGLSRLVREGLPETSGFPANGITDAGTPKQMRRRSRHPFPFWADLFGPQAPRAHAVA